jgi:hypothetical protein
MNQPRTMLQWGSGAAGESGQPGSDRGNDWGPNQGLERIACLFWRLFFNCCRCGDLIWVTIFIMILRYLTR